MSLVPEIVARSRIINSPEVCGGKPCISGTRIRVLDVYVLYELQSKSVDEIVDAFPQLSMSDVFAALAYLWDHRDEVINSLQQEQEIAETLRQNFPSKLEAKLRETGAAPLPS